MSHNHAHECEHHHHHAPTGQRLGFAFFASFGILLVLAVGGVWSHSLALMADAGHVITDIGALGLSWYATRQAERPADHLRTFGYHRTGILAALLNALALLLIAVWITYEAYGRLFGPGSTQPIQSTMMMGVAAVGTVLNLVIGFGLSAHADENLNVRSAFLHVMGDAAASAGVILGAMLIYWTGAQWIDPALSVAIAVLIAFGAWKIVDECVHILMEAVPRGLDVKAIMADLLSIPGVKDVHELHVWSISQGMPSLSCHLVLNDDHVPESLTIVSACNRLLAERYQIEHCTIQAEAEHCSPHAMDCNLAFVQPTHHSHHH